MKEYFTSIEDGLYEVFVFDTQDKRTPYWRLFSREQLYRQAVKDKEITIINYQSERCISDLIKKIERDRKKQYGDC